MLGNIFSVNSAKNTCLQVQCVVLEHTMHAKDHFKTGSKFKFKFSITSQYIQYTFNRTVSSSLLCTLMVHTFDVFLAGLDRNQVYEACCHRLRMPNEAFFIEIQNFWSWADKLGR